MNTNLKKVLLALASFALIAGLPACKKSSSETKETTYESRGGMKKHKRDRDDRDDRDKEGKKTKKHVKKTKTTKKSETMMD